MNDDFDATILEGIPLNELRDFLAWRERVKGTNISEKTLLATDYLNHFNEIVMLIEMVPDMPDMVEECRIWQPLSYAEHFEQSGFSDKALAIEAYGHVPDKFRLPFEECIQQVRAVVATTLQRLDARLSCGETDQLRFDCEASVAMIQKIIQITNGIIHGTAGVMDQGEIDHYLGSA